jgi:hypothetical protein
VQQRLISRRYILVRSAPGNLYSVPGDVPSYTLFVPQPSRISKDRISPPYSIARICDLQQRCFWSFNCVDGIILAYVCSFVSLSTSQMLLLSPKDII